MKTAQKLENDTQTSAYIRQVDLIPAIIPISSATLWRWVKAETLPAPVKLGPRISRHLLEEARREEKHAAAILQIFGDWDEPKMEDCIREFIKSPNPEISSAARESLRLIKAH